MVDAVPSGTESARPFLPALDHAKSQAFYEALGFVSVLDSDDVSVYRIGSTSFLLQRYYQKEWAENFMMQLLVDDLDEWWLHIESLDLPATYGVPEPKPPTTQPWGLRIAYVIDPAGVLWHVAQRRPAVAHDL